ncbi:MAG: DNA mismatch repair protein MutS [Treponematales bacterium]
MNFGDILNEWDKRAAARPAPAAEGLPPERMPFAQVRARQTPANAAFVNAWLHAKGIFDKDAAPRVDPQQAAERRRRLLKKRPDASIDLHGLTQDEAWSSLTNFFRESKNQGAEKVLVIHGKGSHTGSEGALKELVRKFIEACPDAGESGYSAAAAGGSGATWVLIKPGVTPEGGVWDAATFPGR